ncbi:hypothetical protein MRB53_013951 [Persea americana]|uniref:Uncharacterized protein n=1 Tax=Persea americana TaxID=3435 RepID=A0ACC2K9K2_PERAE|nr:hypothetical protein MRB53_013951 [Persea americana]
MEVIRSPLQWVRFYGVPAQARREGVFRLLGDCLGRTVEVDSKTVSKEELTFGRVKILSGKVCKVSKQIHLWVDNLQFVVVVEEGDLTGGITTPPEKDRGGSSYSPSDRVFDQGHEVEDGDHSFPDPGLHSGSELRRASDFITSNGNPGSVVASQKLHHANQMGHGVSNGPGLFSVLKRADHKYRLASSSGDYSSVRPRALTSLSGGELAPCSMELTSTIEGASSASDNTRPTLADSKSNKLGSVLRLIGQIYTDSQRR